MIYGNVNNEFFDQQAALLPAPLGAALHFLKETDLAAHEPGRFDIELDGVPMILQVLDLETSPREALRPEIHRKYIDVQFLAPEGRKMQDTTMMTAAGSSMKICSQRRGTFCSIRTGLRPSAKAGSHWRSERMRFICHGMCISLPYR